MKNIFKIYAPDYDEICRFKSEFEKFESDMTLLRESIFNWLDKKDDNNIEDIETMLVVEIEEINKTTIGMSMLPIITFLLGILGTMYKEAGIIHIFIGIMLCMCVILGFGLKKMTKYNKYYSFLQKMIERYKKNKSK